MNAIVSEAAAQASMASKPTARLPPIRRVAENTSHSVIAQAATLLKPGGILVLELGYNSLDPVRVMLGAGWDEIAVQHDLAGLPRVLAAQLRTILHP